MNTPNKLEWLDELMEFDVWCMCEADECVLYQNYKEARAKIATKLAEAYRQGYNDNSRDCICDSVDYRGFTERVPHRHLMDDGESHDIRPDVQLTNDKELEQ